MSKPYLIQRVMRKEKESDRTGVDQYFRFHYMGSAEFEFGALPKSLERMRCVKNINAEFTVSINSSSKNKDRIFYYGPKHMFSIAMEFFQEHYETEDHSFSTKEATCIHDVFYHPVYKNKTVAWWDILNHFVCFKSNKDRKLWKRSLK